MFDLQGLIAALGGPGGPGGMRPMTVPGGSPDFGPGPSAVQPMTPQPPPRDYYGEADALDPRIVDALTRAAQARSAGAAIPNPGLPALAPNPWHTVLAALGGLAANSMDRRNMPGTGFLTGLQRGFQEQGARKYQGQMQDVQQQRAKSGTDEQNALADASYLSGQQKGLEQRGGAIAKLSSDAAQKEADRENQRLIWGGRNSTTLSKAEIDAASREKVAGIRADNQTERVLLSEFGNADTEPKQRALFGDLLRSTNPTKFGGLTDEELAAVASRYSPKQTAELGAGAANQARASYYKMIGKATRDKLAAGAIALKAQAGLDDKRAAQVAKATYWMDGESQVKIAQGWAQIDNLASIKDSRQFRDELAKSGLDQKGLQGSAGLAATALRTLSAQADSIRNAQGKIRLDIANGVYSSDPEGLKQANDDIKGLQDRLTETQTEYNGMLGAAGKLRGQMEAKSGLTRTATASVGQQDRIRQLNQDREDALTAGKPRTAVDALYNSELKKILAGK